MPLFGLTNGFNQSDFNPIKVEGFDELKRKIKKLDDSVKRREIIKIQKKVAKPLVEKAKLEAPEGPTGNLVDSIGIVVGRSKVYPNIYVTARVKGGNKGKGNHAHLVHEGTTLRRRKGRGKKNRSKGSTGVMPSNPFLIRAFNSARSGLIANYEKEIAGHIKRQIKKLSK